jgi:hypothetical protein
MTYKLTALPLAFAILATAFAGTADAKKVCSNTYNPDGTRCTFCYYTTQPGSGSTVCIKIKAKDNSGSSSSSISKSSKLKMSSPRK